MPNTIPGGPRTARGSIVVPVALLLVVATLFALQVRRHYFLGDDAFISFRYAAHLAEGKGLVWNDGEPVEGYTNFLWVVLLAGAMRVGLAPEVVSNVLGIASGVALLLAMAAFSARRSSWSEPLVWLAPGVLASSRSFTAWSSGGLETTLFALLVFVGYYAFVVETERRSGWPVGSALLLALATLTRPEGGLFTCIAGLFFLAGVIRRRRTLGALLIWAGPWVLVVGTHLLWRRAYYGSWLPNTFHAKVPGLWLEQGWRYLELFAEDYRFHWFLPLALVPVVLSRRRFAPALFLAATTAFVLYLLAIGGDRFEFRFLVFVMPFAYWLVAEGIRSLARMPVEARALHAARTLAVAAATVGLVLTTWWGSNAVVEEVRSGVASLERIAGYAERRAEEGRFLRALIDDGLLPDDLVLSVGGAGALPYYTRWPTVDRRGLNDVTVARTPIPARRGTIGHERDAPFEYLRERGVVVFDVFNRIVHDELPGGRLPRWVRHGEGSFDLRAVAVRGRYLVFGTLAEDAEFRRIFAGVEILQ